MNERVLGVIQRLDEDRALEGESGVRFWNVPRSTGAFLSLLIPFLAGRSDLGSGPGLVKVLEIGTSNGYSGIWMASALQELGSGELLTVESHAGRFELARENFLEAGVSGFVRQVKGHAPEVFETDEFAGKSDYFDLIFIDSTKLEYVSYLDFVLPMLKKGGLLIADNCVSHREELGEFFAQLEKMRMEGSGGSVGEIDFFLLEMDSGLMLVTKK